MKTAVVHNKENLLTKKLLIVNEYRKKFRDRLTCRYLYDSYMNKEYIKNNLFDDVMFLVSLKKIPNITIDE